jgi:hypothetical protein
MEEEKYHIVDRYIIWVEMNSDSNSMHHFQSLDQPGDQYQLRAKINKKDINQLYFLN